MNSKAKIPASAQNAGERTTFSARPPIDGRSMPCFIYPAVGLEPPEGLHDALLDRELRFPAGGLNFFRVEKDERIVANPAAVAAGIIEPRLQAERGTDAADAV